MKLLGLLKIPSLPPCHHTVSLCPVWHCVRNAARAGSWFPVVVEGWRLLPCLVVSSSKNTYKSVDGHVLHFLLDLCCSDNWEYNIRVTRSWSIIYNELIAKFIYYD